MGKYRKFVTALLGVILSGLVVKYGSANQWVNDAILLGTALGIYAVPNEPRV